MFVAQGVVFVGPGLCSAFCDGQVLGSTKASVEVCFLQDHGQVPGMGGTVPEAHHWGFTPDSGSSRQNLDEEVGGEVHVRLTPLQGQE